MPTTSSPIKIRSAAGSTFAKAPSAAVTPAAEVATIISGRTTMSEPQPKHAPKTPKGTEFKWDANGAIRSKPFKVNEPAALSLKLVDTVGTTHTFNYPSQIIDWTSKEAVLKANTWYGQLISRKLNRPNPTESRATRYRPPWSKQEKMYLENLIKAKIRTQKSKLTGKDWQAIVDDQNARFAGRKVLPGQSLALSSESSRTKNCKPSQTRPIAKKEMAIPLRTVAAILAVIRKWPDSMRLINDLLDEVGWNNDSDNGGYGDIDKGNDGDVEDGAERDADEKIDGDVVELDEGEAKA